MIEKGNGVEATLQKIFGTRTHIKLVMLFLGNEEYLNDIAGLARTLNVAHATAKKAVIDLAETEILSEKKIGNSRIIELNKSSPIGLLIQDFIKSLNRIAPSPSSQIKSEP